MTDYLCVDGPLAGRVIGAPDVDAPGRSVVIEVTDVGQGPGETPRFEYVVESRSTECRAGRLRFAAASRAADLDLVPLPA